MKTLNGHHLNKGDQVKIVSRIGYTEHIETKIVTHVCARFLHVHDMIFHKSSGNGANTAAAGLKLQRV